MSSVLYRPSPPFTRTCHAVQGETDDTLTFDNRAPIVERPSIARGRLDERTGRSTPGHPGPAHTEGAFARAAPRMGDLEAHSRHVARRSRRESGVALSRALSAGRARLDCRRGESVPGGAPDQ